MKKSELRHIIKEEIDNVLNTKQLEEGWKDWVISGAMGISSLLPAFGQNPNHKQPGDVNIKYDRVDNVRPDSPNERDLIRRGYKKIDTQQKDIKEKILKTTELKFGSTPNTWFDLGGYKLSKSQKDSILHTLQKIDSITGQLENISVEASTDSTPVGQGLKNNSGQSITNNDQLAQARADSIIVEILTIGKKLDIVKNINNGDIKVNKLVEKGGINNPTTRYCKIIIQYSIETKKIKQGPIYYSYAKDYESGIQKNSGQR